MNILKKDKKGKTGLYRVDRRVKVLLRPKGGLARIKIESCMHQSKSKMLL